MKITTSFFLCFIFAVFCTSAVYGNDVQTTVKNNTAFAVDLYQELAKDSENIFFSPYSISTALAITYAGTKKETKQEMADVLHFSIEQNDLAAAFDRLQKDIRKIQENGAVKLTIANSLWIQKDFTLLDSFIELNQKYYDAGLNYVDFKNTPEKSRQTINLWVEEKTNQKIKNLLLPEDVTALTRLILCNAIYFKGAWETTFDRSMTQDRVFYLSYTNTIQTPTMGRESDFRYKEFDDFTAIELPYRGNDISMFIFLPKDIEGLPKLEEYIADNGIEESIASVIRQPKSKVIVHLPKFKTTLRLKLKSILSKMGMPQAFIYKVADFTGMYPVQELFIGQVIHKAFIEIDEEGTEATAATAVVMKEGISLDTSPIKTFPADHPFIFCIRENKNGSILFMGRITDPRE